MKTFNEWSNLGYKILKGSKAISFNNDGIALFSKDQVVLSVRAGYDYYQPKSNEWYEGLPEGYYEEERLKYERDEKERKANNKEYMERYKGIFDGL